MNKFHDPLCCPAFGTAVLASTEATARHGGHHGGGHGDITAAGTTRDTVAAGTTGR